MIRSLYPHVNIWCIVLLILNYSYCSFHFRHFDSGAAGSDDFHFYQSSILTPCLHFLKRWYIFICWIINVQHDEPTAGSRDVLGTLEEDEGARWIYVWINDPLWPSPPPVLVLLVGFSAQSSLTEFKDNDTERFEVNRWSYRTVPQWDYWLLTVLKPKPTKRIECNKTWHLVSSSGVRALWSNQMSDQTFCPSLFVSQRAAATTLKGIKVNI